MLVGERSDATIEDSMLSFTGFHLACIESQLHGFNILTLLLHMIVITSTWALCIECDYALPKTPKFYQTIYIYLSTRYMVFVIAPASLAIT